MTSDGFRRYKVLSLFSGCGGLDLGFAQFGADSLELHRICAWKRAPRGTFFEIVWANDIFPPSCETYSANFNAGTYTDPDEPYSSESRVFQGDVAKVDFEKAVDGEEIDVVLGGFPCQDFSLIRGREKREGIRVKRGRLYCHFVRALACLQPKLFVAENVKGLVSANEGLAYKQILDDFENLNIRWEEIEAGRNGSLKLQEIAKSKELHSYKILFSAVSNFAKLGVPQGRERLIIIGLRNDLLGKLNLRGVSTEKVMQEVGEALKGNGSLFSSYPLTPLEVFYGETLGKLNETYRLIMLQYEKDIANVKSLRQAEFLKHVWPYYSMDIWKDYFWVNRNNKQEHSLETWTGQEKIERTHKEILCKLGYYGKSLYDIGTFEDGSNEVLHELKRVKDRMMHIPPGENHEFVRNTEYHVTGLMSNVYRRVHPLKPSPTIIAKGGGGTWGYHFAQDHQRLTNRERARLQTFPDSFVFKGKPGEVRIQIGEAVPPLASETVARHVAKILNTLKGILHCPPICADD